MKKTGLTLICAVILVMGHTTGYAMGEDRHMHDPKPKTSGKLQAQNTSQGDEKSHDHSGAKTTMMQHIMEMMEVMEKISGDLHKESTQKDMTSEDLHKMSELIGDMCHCMMEMSHTMKTGQVNKQSVQNINEKVTQVKQKRDKLFGTKWYIPRN
ncbi:hypothetical protein [Candidatus Magnetominusculus xianensis]|uniref:Secreted protein n=1 Tax=Candidatus Magnetominusculus xianensis TaxID=1748249 RepID=A0ABR5SE84_9BACT|nr:hypothetical protein [Candidatus Magnetominusculus xianensis]KWT84113.1 hypothetical protein ASN18_2041 [Candidatus Magnetominusculus xianensis]MBF0402407.1 hypothetical protein [Nitrospirota bacterium]